MAVPLAVSVAVILGTLLTGDLVRNLIVNPKLRDDSLIKKILLDSILALELCASSFEIGVIFQHYGMVAWTFCVFGSTFYQQQIKPLRSLTTFSIFLATSCIPDESYIPTFAINSGHTVHNGPAIHYLKAFGGTDAYKLCRHLNDADFCGRGPREAFIMTR